MYVIICSLFWENLDNLKVKSFIQEGKKKVSKVKWIFVCLYS